MVAGIAAMEHYPAGGGRADQRAWRPASRAGVNAAIATSRSSRRRDGLWFVRRRPFRGRASAQLPGCRASAIKRLKRLMHLALLAEGVFCAPRLMFAVSTAMDETVIDQTIGRFEAALDRIV